MISLAMARFTFSTHLATPLGISLVSLAPPAIQTPLSLWEATSAIIAGRSGHLLVFPSQLMSNFLYLTIFEPEFLFALEPNSFTH